MMVIQQYGNRQPRLARILITGGGNSGKTTLASKFASSPDRVMFISTDGNALRQGYKAIEFVFPSDPSQMLPQFKKALELAATDKANFDVIVWDLVEDIDERLQVLLQSKIENYKTTLAAWGDIHKFFRAAHAYLMAMFRDKTIVLLSRDVEEYNKNGDLIGYIPALRKKLKNIILKDQCAEIRCYIDKGVRKFSIDNLRFDEMKSEIERIVAAKPIIPTSAVQPKPTPQQPQNNEPILPPCDDCGNEIKGIITNKGVKYTANQIANNTTDTYNCVLCYDCAKKRKEANNA